MKVAFTSHFPIGSLFMMGADVSVAVLPQPRLAGELGWLAVTGRGRMMGERVGLGGRSLTFDLSSASCRTCGRVLIFLGLCFLIKIRLLMLMRAEAFFPILMALSPKITLANIYWVPTMCQALH